MDFSRMSLLIAAGGQSRRMGRDKRWLSWQGRSMVGGLLEKAVQQGFQDIFLCIDTPSKQWHELAGSYGARLVPDEQICCGPMEGLRRGLSMLRTEYALASGPMPRRRLPPRATMAHSVRISVPALLNWSLGFQGQAVPIVMHVSHGYGR